MVRTEITRQSANQTEFTTKYSDMSVKINIMTKSGAGRVIYQDESKFRLTNPQSEADDPQRIYNPAARILSSNVAIFVPYAVEGGDGKPEPDEEGDSSLLSGIIDDILASVKNIITDLVSGLLDKVKGLFDDVLDTLSNLVAGAIDTIRAFVGNIIEKIQEMVEAAVDRISGYANEVIDNIEYVVLSAIDNISGVVDAVKDWIGDALQGLIEDNKELIDSIVNWAESIFSEFKSGITNVISKLSTWIDDTYVQIVDQVKRVYDEFSIAIQATLEDTSAYLTAKYDDISKGVNDLVSKAVTAANVTIESTAQFARDISESMDDLTDSLLNVGIPFLSAMSKTLAGSVIATPADTAKAGLEKDLDAWESTFKILIESASGEAGIFEQMFGPRHVVTIGGVILSLMVTTLAQVQIAGQAGMIVNMPKLTKLQQDTWEKTPLNIFSMPETASMVARRFLTPEKGVTIAKKGGYDAENFSASVKISQTYVEIERLREAYHRGFIVESEVMEGLGHLGFSDASIDIIIRTLPARPGIQDLIQMGVRDVFSPEIVARFELFSDLPPDYVTEAAKSGLSRDWAEKYWGAHWVLPSPNQGFEMFHRGVIDEKDLSLLLRAIDVSPFWRDKLRAIAYNNITRVDVRRMYRFGVIDRDEVFRRYKRLGYDPVDAELMTKFTEKYEDVDDDIESFELAELTRAQIKSLFNLGTLSFDEAVSNMEDTGYNNETSIVLVQSWIDSELIRDREQLIDRAIRRAIREDSTTAEFESYTADMMLTSDERDRADKIIELERNELVSIPSKSELKSMYLKGIIDETLWRSTMKQYGYNSEWIERYHKLITV